MGDNREHVFPSWLSQISDIFAQQELRNGFLSYITEDQPLNVQRTSIQEFISHINVCLGKSQLRHNGATLLLLVLDQCSTEVYTSGAKTWANLLLQAIQSHDPPSEHRISCSAIGEVLMQSTSFPELHRDLATSVLPQLVPALLKADKQWLHAALECLMCCMKHFSGPCGPFKFKIENRLVQLLEDETVKISKKASQCYALLAHCGGGGSQGQKYTEAWKLSADTLTASLSQTLDALYQNLEADLGSGKEKSKQTLVLPEISDEEPVRCCRLVARFAIISYTFQQLINQDFPAPVAVPIQDLVQLLCRTLAVTPNLLCKRPTADRMFLSSVIPALHVEAFKLLECMISCLQGHLVLYSSTINKLFVQTLSWSQCEDNVYGHQRPYSGVRVGVYRALQLWLSTLGCSGGIEGCAEVVVKHVLMDATPQTDTMKSTSTSSQSTWQMEPVSKKKKKHGARDVGQLSSQRKINLLANSSVCMEALQTCCALLTAVGPFIKPELYKSIQELCVCTLLRVWQQPESPPLPYSHGACREALCRSLMTCVKTPNPKWPPPIHCAVRLFSLGQKDLDPHVRSYCQEALSLCEVLIHSRAPSLAHPVTAEQVAAVVKSADTPQTELIFNIHGDHTNSYDQEKTSVTDVIAVPRTLKRKVDEGLENAGETSNKILKAPTFGEELTNTGEAANKVLKAPSFEGERCVDEAAGDKEDIDEPDRDQSSRDTSDNEDTSPVEKSEEGEKGAVKSGRKVDVMELQITPPDSPEEVEEEVQEDNEQEAIVGNAAEKLVEPVTGRDDAVDLVSSGDEDNQEVVNMDTALTAERNAKEQSGAEMMPDETKDDEKSDKDVEEMLNTFVDAAPDPY